MTGAEERTQYQTCHKKNFDLEQGLDTTIIYKFRLLGEYEFN